MILMFCFRLFTAAVFLISLSGCAIKERADPVASTFIDDVPLESKVDGIPFLQSWIVPHEQALPYKSIYIKPVRTDLIPKDMWRQSKGLAVSSEQEFQKDAAVIARYFRIRLISELNNMQTKRFAIVDTPDNDSLVLEIAITELVLSEPIVRAAALAVPFPGVDLALSTISDPHVSFAARFTSHRESKLVATVADRRFPPIRLIDLNKLRARSSAREIIANWARQLAQAIQLDEFKKVQRNSWFSILPW